MNPLYFSLEKVKNVNESISLARFKLKQNLKCLLQNSFNNIFNKLNECRKCVPKLKYIISRVPVYVCKF